MRVLKEKDLGVLHYHEALDRTNSVIAISQDVLLEHAVFEHSKHIAWRDKVIKAQEILAEVYQEIGNSPEYAELVKLLEAK